MFLDCPLLISLSAIAAVYLVETNIDCIRECISKYYAITIKMDFLVYLFPCQFELMPTVVLACFLIVCILFMVCTVPKLTLSFA